MHAGGKCLVKVRPDRRFDDPSPIAAIGASSRRGPLGWRGHERGVEDEEFRRGPPDDRFASVLPKPSDEVCGFKQLQVARDGAGVFARVEFTEQRAQRDWLRRVRRRGVEQIA